MTMLALDITQLSILQMDRVMVGQSEAEVIAILHYVYLDFVCSQRMTSALTSFVFLRLFPPWLLLSL
jgi:hypothetical protein